MNESLPRDVRLVTGIVPKGRATALQQALIAGWNLHAVNIHHARGVGRAAPLSQRGIGEQQEKEVLEVIVDGEIADEVFAFLYQRMELGQSPGSLLYMSRPERSSRFELREPEADSAGPR